MTRLWSMNKTRHRAIGRLPAVGAAPISLVWIAAPVPVLPRARIVLHDGALRISCRQFHHVAVRGMAHRISSVYRECRPVHCNYRATRVPVWRDIVTLLGQSADSIPELHMVADLEHRSHIKVHRR